MGTLCWREKRRFDIMCFHTNALFAGSEYNEPRMPAGLTRFYLFYISRFTTTKLLLWLILKSLGFSVNGATNSANRFLHSRYIRGRLIFLSIANFKNWHVFRFMLLNKYDEKWAARELPSTLTETLSSDYVLFLTIIWPSYLTKLSIINFT